MGIVICRNCEWHRSTSRVWCWKSSQYSFSIYCRGRGICSHPRRWPATACSLLSILHC